MNQLKIASRNILRNVRRSVMTVSAICVGAVSMLLFGEFVTRIFAQIETRTVRTVGHLAVFKAGYFKYGVGDPAAYGISDYERILELIRKDPVAGPRIRVVSPTISLFGIAGNFDKDASKTFLGRGVVPEDYNRMRSWDEHALHESSSDEGALSVGAENHGIVGVGLARVLKLCDELKLVDCARGDMPASEAPKSVSGVAPRDFSGLASGADGAAGAEAGSGAPRLDLLAATSAGAPNVVNFFIDRAEQQGFKEIDDSLVLMNFGTAQRLLYGRGEGKAVGVTIQLHHTADVALVRERLRALFQENHLQLEVRDLKELQPFYKQVLGMFSAIFGFVSMIMLTIVLFTVVNTMSMSVMERTQEIGTLRALGIKRAGIVSLFVTEGALLGLLGSCGGLLIGAAFAQAVNGSSLTWQPPGQASPIPLRLMTHGNAGLLLVTWLLLTLMATLAAWIPARRAARMNVVDALGHV